MNEDLISSLKGMLGDNADEKINSVMNMLKSDNSNKTEEKAENVQNQSFQLPSQLASPEGLQYITKIKGIIDEMGHANDRRSNLLMSLKPYMRSSRAQSIDNAVKILNLSKLAGLFKL